MSAPAAGETLEEIALFPLRTVLFPGGPLRLRIFEPRYLDMVGAAMKSGREFGVLLVSAGGEVGPADVVDFGTSARIVDFHPLPDGLLGIACRGTRRFRLANRRRQSDGLNLGSVRWLPEPPAEPLDVEFEQLGRLLAELLPELGDEYQGIERRLDDAVWVGYRLAEVLPLTLADRQRALELEDPRARLTLLREFLAQWRSQRRDGGA
jgi:Lon protease-like protein